MKQKKVYISGRMSGVDRDVYLEQFSKAERLLRQKGYTRIVNPIHIWACRWLWIYKMLEWLFGKEMAYRIVLFYDLWLLMRCDAICLLPGWQRSRGASIENTFAAQYDLDHINLNNHL